MGAAAKRKRGAASIWKNTFCAAELDHHR